MRIASLAQSRGGARFPIVLSAAAATGLGDTKLWSSHMNATVGRSQSYGAYGQALARPQNTIHEAHRERPENVRDGFGLIGWILGAIASMLYAVVMVCLTIVAAAAAILIVPWLLILPVALCGLLIRFTGLFLGGL